jgi:cation transport ATPase
LVGHGKKRIRFGSKGKKIEDFVDPNKDPGSYLKRYLLEEKYKDWFDRNYPDQTIYEAVGLNEWDYNEMKKKLSPDQTVEEKSKTEPEPELESESKIETKSTDTSKIPPTQPAVSEEQQNITKKRTNMLFWLRIGLALIGGASATFLFEGIEDTEEHRWSSIIFMIVLFIITCFIAKGMKINFPKSDRKKLVTTGIGSYIFLYLFAWIMTHTMLNLPKDNFSLPFT